MPVKTQFVRETMEKLSNSQAEDTDPESPKYFESSLNLQHLLDYFWSSLTSN